MAYEPSTDLAVLAACYGFGISSNHPYNDGNKRLAFVVMAVFMGLNSMELIAEESEVVTLMVALASSALDEHSLADWIRSRSAKRADQSR